MIESYLFGIGKVECILPISKIESKSRWSCRLFVDLFQPSKRRMLIFVSLFKLPILNFLLYSF